MSKEKNIQLLSALSSFQVLGFWTANQIQRRPSNEPSQTQGQDGSFFGTAAALSHRSVAVTPLPPQPLGLMAPRQP